MKRFLIAASIVAVSLLAPKAHAQTVIDGKHWHSAESTNGKVTIPEHSVITYIATGIEGIRGNEKIHVGILTYSTVSPVGGIIGPYMFTGEMYTGSKEMEISIDGARKETVIVVSYYN